MRDHTKLRDFEEIASSGSQNLSLFMEQKVSLMSRYLSITKTIKETLMQKNEIKVGILLSKRQDCINRIQKIDLSIQKVINAGAEDLSRISGELKSSFDGYLLNIKSLLEQIAPIDAEVMVMAREETRGIKAELLKIRNTRHAAKSYGSKEKRIPIYMDAKR